MIGVAALVIALDAGLSIPPELQGYAAAEVERCRSMWSVEDRLRDPPDDESADGGAPARPMIRMAMDACLGRVPVQQYRRAAIDNARAEEARSLELRRAATARLESAARLRAQEKEAASMREEDRRQLEEDRRREAVLGDSKIMRPVLSAVLCHNAIVRRSASDEIAREMAYAKHGGGIVDRSKLYALQQKQREVDESTRSLRASLKAQKVTPLSCSDRDVRTALVCMRDIDGDCPDRVGSAVGYLEYPAAWAPDAD